VLSPAVAVTGAWLLSFQDDLLVGEHKLPIFLGGAGQLIAVRVTQQVCRAVWQV
jgi:hypothetical protein